MSAYVMMFNAAHNPVVIDRDKVVLQENGIPLQIRSITCSQPALQQRISVSILSAQTLPKDIATTGLIKTLSNGLIRDSCEVFIASCSYKADPRYRMYTTDTNTISAMIDDAANAQQCREFADGIGQQIATTDSARYRPVIIVINQGSGSRSLPSNIGRRLYLSNSSLYVLEVGENVEANVAELCEKSGGFAASIASFADSELLPILRKILNQARRSSACVIEWESPDQCLLESREVSIVHDGVEASLRYLPDPQVVPSVRHEPFVTAFSMDSIGAISDTTVVVYAERGALNVSSLTVSSSDFSVTPTFFQLEEGDSIELHVRYYRRTPAWCYAQILLNTSTCPYIITVYANATFVLDSAYNALRIVEPKPNTRLIVGDTIEIQWKGGFSSDTVTLEYRLKPDSDWILISDRATGYRHRWMVPAKISSASQLRIRPAAGSRRTQMVAQTRFRSNARGFGADIDVNGNLFLAGEGRLPFELTDKVLVDEGRGSEISYVLAFSSDRRFEWLSRLTPWRFGFETSSLIRDDSGNVHSYGSHVHYYSESGSELELAVTDSLDIHHKVVDKNGRMISFARSGIQNNEKYYGVVSDGSNVRYELSWFDKETLRGKVKYTAPSFGTLVDRTNHLGQIDWTFCVKNEAVSALNAQVVADQENGVLLIVDGKTVTQIGDSVVARNDPAPDYYFIRLSEEGKLLWLKKLDVPGGSFSGAAQSSRDGWIICCRRDGVVTLDSIQVGVDTSSSICLIHLSTKGEVIATTEVPISNMSAVRLLQVLHDGTPIIGCSVPDSVFAGKKYSSDNLIVTLDESGTVLNVRDDLPLSLANIMVKRNGMIISSGSTSSRIQVLDSLVGPPDSLLDREFQYWVLKTPYDEHMDLNIVSPLDFSDTIDRAIHIRAQDVSGAPGDPVEILLLVDSVANIDVATLPSRWTARLQWNSSILFPTSPDCQAIDEKCSVDLVGQWSGTIGPLGSIPSIVTLGQTDRGKITIDSFAWEPTPLRIRTTTTDGEITVTGLCEDPNVRLLIGTASSFSLAARPNPASSLINIELGLREPLTITIELINEMGQTVVTFVDGQPYVKGLHLIGGDVSTIATGMYFLRVRSAKGTLTSRLAIVR